MATTKINQELVQKALEDIVKGQFRKYGPDVQRQALVELGLNYDEQNEFFKVYYAQQKLALLETKKDELPLPLYALLKGQLEGANPGRWDPAALAKTNLADWLKKGLAKAGKLPCAGCTLKAGEAWRGYYLWQEAYADYSQWYVPVEVKEGFDPKVLQNNLWEICEANRTANGIAGYGGTFEAAVVEEQGQYGALITTRNSIPD